MKVNIEVKLQPFKVPNFVLTEGKVGKRQDGFVEAPKYHLSELSDETLVKLCEQFTANVFAKARPIKGSE